MLHIRSFYVKPKSPESLQKVANYKARLKDDKAILRDLFGIC